MKYSGPKTIITPPGPKAREIIARDKRIFSPSLTKTCDLVGYKAEGVYIEDPDGNVFLDFGSGIAVVGVGHRNPEVVAAIQSQLENLLFVNSLDYFSIPQVEYAEMLLSATPGEFPKRVFFTNSGSEAVDTAIKIAKWHTRRPYGIGYLNGFHGRTIGAGTFTAIDVESRRGFSPLYPIAHFVPYPYCYRCLFQMQYPDCGLYCMSYLTDVLFKKVVPPDETAFIMVEPIQGSGGYIVPPKDFLKTLADIAKSHGIILIVDEVQTGFGRTGKMFACEHFGIQPDIITLSKAMAHGLPAGAAVAKADIMDWEKGAHEGTLNGNPIIMEAAKAVLHYIEKNNLIQNARLQGDYLLDKFRILQAKHLNIGDVRGVGLMIGIELVENSEKKPARQKRDALIKEAFKRGLLLLGAGESSLRIAPPLTIKREEIDMGLAIFEESLNRVMR